MGKLKTKKTEDKKITVSQCPYGHEAKAGTLGVVPIDKEAEMYAVMCSECNAIGPSGISPEDALELWNKRHVVVVDKETYEQLAKGSTDEEQDSDKETL